MSNQSWSDKDIAIIGLGCRWPNANDAHEFWEIIRDGRVCFREVPKDRWNHEAFYSASQRDVEKTWTPSGSFIEDIASFDPLHYGISPRQLEVMDPQYRLLIDATRRALLDAGYETKDFNRERMGVFSGLSVSEYKNIVGARVRAMQMLSGNFGPAAGSQELRDAVLEMTSHVVPLRAFSISGVLSNMAATSISQAFDFHGPSFSIDAACAAGSVAIQQAVLQLRAGLIDMAVAGGAYLNLTPENLVVFTRVGAISPNGACRPFDANADGFVQSDGVGVFVLKRLSDAMRDGDEVRAVIKGIGCNNDGRGDGPMAPQVSGQVQVLEQAYKDADVSPATVSYFEAHGTGTRVGDPVEIESLGRILRQAGVDAADAPLLGSVKGNIGHAMSAAGVAGLFKALKVLEHRTAPPQAGFTEAHPALELDKWPLRIENQASELRARGDAPLRVGASSFGFGGTNSHFVLEEAPEPVSRFKPTKSSEPIWPEAVIVSGPTLEVLGAHLDELADAIETGRAKHESLRDIAYTMNATRRYKRYRAVLTVQTKTELVIAMRETAKALAGADEDSAMPLRAAAHATVHDGGENETTKPKIAFLFPGQGAQRTGLLGSVRDRFSTFAETLHRLELGCEDVTKQPLSSFVYPSVRDQAAEDALTATEICQPAMAALSLALAQTLRNFGIDPDVSLGHSLGEFTALANGGVLEPVAAVRLVAERGLAMRELPLEDTGAMAAVMASADQVEPLITKIDGVCIANFNHPGQVSLSGTTEGVERAVGALQAAGLEVKRLAVSHAFHSSLLEGVSSRMDDLLGEIETHAPEHLIASCIAADPHSEDSAASRQVMRAHATAPVQFVRGLEQAKAAGATIFVQVGAGKMLTGFARSTLGKDGIHTVNLAPVDRDDRTLELMEGLATLAALGIPVSYRAIYAGAHLVDLPATRLDEQIYWAIKPEHQLLPDLQHPIPSADEGFGIIDVSSAAAPTTIEPAAPSDGLLALFAQQNELIRAQTEILAAQTRVLLNDPAALDDASALPSPAPILSVPPSPAVSIEAKVAKAIAEPIEAATAKAESESASTELESDQIREQVLNVVAKVSAFPRKSLRESQRLIDELGFDSIMVADLGKSLETSFPKLGGLPQSLFSASTTVGDLAEHVITTIAGGGAPEAAEEVLDRPLRSFRVEAKAIRRPAGRQSPELGTWLVIEDETPVSAAISARLESRGAKVYRIELTKSDIAIPEKLVPGSKQVWPRSKLSGLAKVVERSGHALDGFVFAAPAAIGDRGYRNPLTAIHPLAQALSPASFAVITHLGGKLGLEKSPALTKNGSQAALLGYTKALSRERPGARVRAIDIDPSDDAEQTAVLVVDELLGADRSIEVGFSGGERYLPVLAPADVDLSPSAGAFSEKDVVLITGGAGDIGAMLAKKIAAKKPGAIALLGRRAPDERIAKLLLELSAGACQARYYACDITNDQATLKTAEAITKDLGNVTIAVHSAGLIEDAPISKKGLESIERVMNVKVLGLGSLLASFPALETLVLFSSWAGRFGNPGQSDYSAANEILDRVAVVGAGKTRVVSIDWPPWSSTDMVRSIPETIQKAMKASGVTFVDDQEGADAFLSLLFDQASGIHVIARDLPEREAHFSHEELLDLESNPYLEDHRLRGRPILPLASATDLVGWAAREALGLSESDAIEIDELTLINGVDVSEPLVLAVRVDGRVGESRPKPVSVDIDFRPLSNPKAWTSAYRAKVRLNPVDAETKIVVGGEIEPLPFDVSTFYSEHTFHGPMLQGIEAIEKLTSQGVIGVVRPAELSRFLPKSDRAGWALDPLVLDASFQLAGYWAWVHHQRAGYPIAFDRFVSKRPFANASIRAHVELVEATDDRFVGNIRYETLDGELIGTLEGIQGRFASEDAQKEQAGTNGHGQESVALVPDESYRVANFPEVEALEQRLEMAKLIGLDNPYFPVHEGTARNRSVVKGEEMLNYSSYNYLGLSGHPEVVKAAQDAIAQYGTSVSASRIASGERPIHRELEKGIADHVGVEDAIVLVSGHATNVTTIGTLFNSEDIIFHDSLIHDSILGGIKLSGAVRRPFPHQDYAALERSLDQIRGGYRRALICAEGIYSMDGDICDLPRLIELKKKYKSMLLIDEAHSIGVLGPNGSGVSHHFDGVDPNDVDIWMGTLSKSFASCGGYIAGSESLVRYLKYSAGGFVYSAGITPPNAAAAIKSLEIMRAQPEIVAKLIANSKLFLELCKQHGIDTGMAVGAAVIPAIVGNSMDCLKLSAALAKRKINVQPIVYPAVEDDAARLRFFLSSTHTEDELRHTVSVLAEELEKIRQASATGASATF